MTTYLFVAMKVNDQSWVAEYQANVPTIVHKYGGEYLAVAETIKRYEGNGPDPDGIVLITFPSIESIESFLSDPEYHPYRAAQLAAASGDVLAFTTRA